MIQSKLLKDLEEDSFIIDEETFGIFFRPVNDTKLKSEKNFSKKEKDLLLNVFKSFKTSKLIDLNELSLKTNCKEWVGSLISEFNESHIKYLINDFADEMNTNMREKNKYVILILMKDKLILAHSKMGEKSISPDFKVFDRMLDKDNLLRFVSFELINQFIKVSYYEKFKSKFLIDWLGVSNKKLFYEFGGENKFYTSFNNYPVVLELQDEDVEDLLDNGYLKFENNSIRITTPIELLKIDHIQRSSMRFSNCTEFFRDYTSRKYDIKLYQEKYNNLLENLDRYSNKFFDCEDSLQAGNKEYIKKENSDITMLFCNDFIELDNEFFNVLKVSIINNNNISLIHIGDKFSETPIKIRNLSLFNQLNIDVTKPLIDFFNYEECSNSLEKILLYVIFSCLSNENNDKNIHFFFDKFSNDLISELSNCTEINENEIIELKDRDYFVGKDNQIIKKVSQDIAKKLDRSNFKLYIFGYSEQTKSFRTLESSKYKDERVDKIENSIKEKTGLTNLNLYKLTLNSEECILLLVVQK